MGGERLMRRRRGALWCVVGLSLLANTHAAFHTRPPLLRLRRSERLPLMQLPKLKLPKLQPLEAAVEPLEAAVEARTAAHDEGAILFNRADHVFTQIDTSNDGFLSSREIFEALRMLGIRDMPLSEVRALVGSFDDDNNGRLGREEFARLLRSLHPSSPEALQKALPDPHAGMTIVDLERNATALMTAEFAFRDPLTVCALQDLLFKRFRNKYVQPAGDELPPQYLEGSLPELRKKALLDALRGGDLMALYNSIAAGEDWNFVFEPARDRYSRRYANEGWCRSPLALLVRPDEGNLYPFMGDVPKKDRLRLIEAALEAGVADPNYPKLYWSSPLAHACFEGDVEALSLLHKYGAELDQKVEWVLQSKPEFTLVHAAAFNGNLRVLKWLEGKVEPSIWRELDGEGSNVLHTALEASRDMDTCIYLFEQMGVDGFALNKLRRSPLSMSVEHLPEFAQVLLASKARFEYRWWGSDLFWYSFDGIVLPLANAVTPLTFSDEAGKPYTFEQLVQKHERKELLSVPVVRTLLFRKWERFGSKVFAERTILYGLLFVAVLANSLLLSNSIEASYKLVADAVVEGAPTELLLVGEDPKPVVTTIASMLSNGLTNIAPEWEQDQILGPLSIGGLVAIWPIFLSFELAELREQREKGSGIKGYLSSFWNVLDVTNLVFILMLLALRVSEIVLEGAPTGLTRAVAETIERSSQPLPAILQIAMSLRALQYASLARSLGPLLVTVGGMLKDVTQFFGIYAAVLIGFANAFFVTFALADAQTTYPEILGNQVLWLLNSVEEDLFFDSLPDGLNQVGDVLFWGYVLISYFVLLNLLVAVFNSTYEKINAQAFSEWLFLRQETMLDFELTGQGGFNGFSAQSVEEFYKEVSSVSNQRSVERDESEWEEESA